MIINPVKGTHDLFGQTASRLAQMETQAKLIAAMHAYHEIRPPVIEQTALFTRSVGPDSDIVRKEMYTFLDKAGRSLTLRPEFTAGIVRSIITNKLYVEAELPLKFFYAGPCFRYERPQAGRYRQFHQFGCEAIGAPSAYLDAETIALGRHIIGSYGFKKVVLKINTLGDETSRLAYKKALTSYFETHIEKMCPDCQARLKSNPLRILDCKVPADQKIIAGAPRISQSLSEEAGIYFKEVQLALKDLSIDFKIDETLVRGLDYYSGVVWEYDIDDEGAPAVGAVGGGGHYAGLVKELGGPDLAGVGFSLGLERLLQVLTAVLPPLEDEGPDYYIIPLEESALEKFFPRVEPLRLLGLVVSFPYKIRPLSTALKAAVKARARFAVIIGSEELAKEEVTVKNLRDETQTKIPLASLEKDLVQLLSRYLEGLLAAKKNDGSDD